MTKQRIIPPRWGWYLFVAFALFSTTLSPAATASQATADLPTESTASATVSTLPFGWGPAQSAAFDTPPALNPEGKPLVWLPLGERLPERGRLPASATVGKTSSGSPGLNATRDKSPSTGNSAAVTSSGLQAAPGELITITVTPSPVQVVAGTTQAFTASGTDDLGNPVLITPTWGTDVGAINSSGWFTAQQTPAPASGTVSASYGGVTGTAAVTVQPGPLDHLELTGYPASTVAGDPFPSLVVVTAYDSFGNTKTDYLGTVQFSSSDGLAALPANYTFVVGDAGTHSFSGSGFKLFQTPSQTISVRDLATSIGQTSAGIDVDPADLDRFAIGTVASGQVAGLGFTLTITAFDAWDNLKTDYSGPPSLEDTTGTIVPQQTTCGWGTGACGQSVVITRAHASDYITVADPGGVAQRSNAFSVLPAAQDHIRINSAADNGGQAYGYPVEVGSHTMDIYGQKPLWAGCYDRFDNYCDDVDARWGATGVLAQGLLAPNPGSSTIFTPAAVLSGTGVITATPLGPGLGDTTGQFHVKAPQLIISKVDDPDPAPAAGFLQYTIVYTNVGNAAAQGLRITETYDARVSYTGGGPKPTNPPPGAANVWTRDTLGAGASAPIYVNVLVDNSLVPNTVLTNVVTVGGRRLGQTTFTETTVVTSTPELTLTLDAQPDPVDAGGNLVYQIQYVNQGTAPVSNVYITMTYDNNLTFVGSDTPPVTGTDNVWYTDTLPAGESRDIAVTLRVDEYMIDQDILASSVRINSDETSEFSAFEQTLVHAPVLQLQKTASSEPAIASRPLTYTLVYSNVGHTAARSMHITDAVPANTNYASCQGLPCSHSGGIVTWVDADGLAAGLSHTVKMVVDVQRNVDSGTVLTNLARVRVVGTPAYSAVDQITSTVISAPSLWLTLSDGKTGVRAGERLVYALNYNNIGNGNAYDTIIVANVSPLDYLASLECVASAPADCAVAGEQVTFTLGTVPGGASGSVQMIATLKDPLPAGARHITATATIHTPTPGDPPAGNSAQDEDDILTRPDLIVTADYQNLMPWPGKRITYTLHYSNAGHIATTDVVITATQPPNTTFEDAASDPGWVSQGGGRYRYEHPNEELDFGERGDPLFVVVLTTTHFTPGMNNFDAFFEIDDDGRSGSDQNPASNVFSAILGVPNLTCEKVVVDRPVWIGQTGRITITLRNTGRGIACGIYNPGGCTGFAVDAFLNPPTPPASYPLERFGDCYVSVDPILPGFSKTTVITFTPDREVIENNPEGNCLATPLNQLYLKVDNWAPNVSPSPAAFGLVPEYNEFDNVCGPITSRSSVFLPLMLREY